MKREEKRRKKKVLTTNFLFVFCVLVMNFSSVFLNIFLHLTWKELNENTQVRTKILTRHERQYRQLFDTVLSSRFISFRCDGARRSCKSTNTKGLIEFRNDAITQQVMHLRHNKEWRINRKVIALFFPLTTHYGINSLTFDGSDYHFWGRQSIRTK